MSQKVRETNWIEKLADAVWAHDAFSSGTVLLRTHGFLCGTDAAAKCSFDVAHKMNAPLPGA
jgi:hypothetical protein